MKQLLLIVGAMAVSATAATAATPPFFDPVDVHVTNPSLDVNVVNTMLPYPFYATANGEKGVGELSGTACATIVDTYVRVTGMGVRAVKGISLPVLDVSVSVNSAGGDPFHVFYRRVKEGTGALIGAAVFYNETVPIAFSAKKDDQVCVTVRTGTSSLGDTIGLGMTLYGEAY